MDIIILMQSSHLLFLQFFVMFSCPVPEISSPSLSLNYVSCKLSSYLFVDTRVTTLFFNQNHYVG